MVNHLVQLPGIIRTHEKIGKPFETSVPSSWVFLVFKEKIHDEG